MLPTTGAEARKLGVARYFSGKPCKRGHISPRLASNLTCLACANERYAQAREEDPERFRAYSRKNNQAYHVRNPGKHAEAYAKHRDKHLAHAKKRAAENRDKSRTSKRRWKGRNAHKVAEYARRRWAAQRRATPPWLTPTQIAEMEEMYLDAMTRPDGPWHVDHIVPILGKNVCGLHVPWNLRVIPAQENWSKNAKLIEELATAP